MDKKEILSKIIGKTYEQAGEMIRNAGYDFRLIFIDGKPLIVTRDYDHDRFNLIIEHNTVVEADLG